MSVEGSDPDLSVPVPVTVERPTIEQRIVAAVEVVLCSDFPTQLLLGAAFAALGVRPQTADGSLNPTFVVALSLADTALLVGLMAGLIVARGDRPRAVFLGSRPIIAEARHGLPLTLIAFSLAVVVLLVVRSVAPWLHTVDRNPLQDLIRTPRDAVLFAVVVVVAGGVREELQRAFLLHRFERWLGGGRVGVVVASAAFGAGHLMQGADAAIATGVLGAFWAITYLRRRSVVAPVVSHSGFNLVQLVQFLAVGR